MTDVEKIKALSHALGLVMGVINDIEDKNLLEEKHKEPIQRACIIVRDVVYGLGEEIKNGTDK